MGLILRGFTSRPRRRDRGSLETLRCQRIPTCAQHNPNGQAGGHIAEPGVWPHSAIWPEGFGRYPPLARAL